MHDIFIEVYGTDYLDSSYEFVEIPAVIQGRETGHFGLGIINLNLESSGELWRTYFLTPRGVVEQQQDNIFKGLLQLFAGNLHSIRLLVHCFCGRRYSYRF